MSQTLARFLGTSLPADVIIDCMAVGPDVLRMLGEREGSKPAIISWMPRDYSGVGHPDWRPEARQLRGADGRIIPALLQRFPTVRGAPARIAAFGFSAGSNSGLRELLRSPADRGALSFVASVDGLHFLKAYDGSVFQEDFDPWVAYARDAVEGRATCVFTGNNLQAPTVSTTKTPEGMKLIHQAILARVGNDAAFRYPPNLSVMRQFSAYGPPLTNGQGGIGNCYFYEYPGTQAVDHIIQARVIVPRIFNTFLAAAWSQGNLGV